MPSNLWDAYRRFIKETVDEQERKTWVLDKTKMDQTAERASHFVLRSNCINDPFEALKIYRTEGWSSKTSISLKIGWMEINCVSELDLCRERYL